MQFFEQMLSKYGFDDGDITPPGAVIYREAYLRVLNYLLDKHKSKVRLVAYNRPGAHNKVMILTVPYEIFAKITEDDVYSGECQTAIANATHSDAVDDAYHYAIGEAHDIDVDQFVDHSVTLNRKLLNNFIANDKRRKNKKKESEKEEAEVTDIVIRLNPDEIAPDDLDPDD